MTISNGESRPWALSISIQVSSRKRCNANCKFCISRTTPGSGQCEKVEFCDMNRLRVGLDYAKNLGATHAILTSKADPTQEDPKYLCELIRTAREYVPLVDMHTNGLKIQREGGSELLKKLVDAGLTMVTFSIASFHTETNKELMGVVQDTKNLIKQAVDLGLLVRCSLVVNKKSSHNLDSIMRHIYQAGNLGAHMVVLREVWIPNDAKKDHPVFAWNKENQIEIAPIQKEFTSIALILENTYELRLQDPLPWGTPVFTIDGRFDDPDHGINITFARCDEASMGRILKSIVHKPNGHGYRNWDRNGDILY